MDFKITTLYYPSGWVAVAQKGLLTFVSERYEDEDSAREDVKKQVDEYNSQPRYNIMDRDENALAHNLTKEEVDEWLVGKHKPLYLIEKM
jgi:cell division protein FtsI/penicillin-binding protein 2